MTTGASTATRHDGFGVRGVPAFARTSLRTRLTLWVVLINCLILWSTGAVFWLYQRSQIGKIMDQRLLVRATELREELEPLLASSAVGAARESLRIIQSSTFRVQVFQADGSPIVPGSAQSLAFGECGAAEALRTGNPTVALLTIPAETPGTPPRLFRAATIRIRGIDDAPLALCVASSNDLVHQQEGMVARVLLLAAIICPVASAISGWFIAGIAVAPFERLRKLASRLAPDSTGTTLEDESVGATREVVRLARELDDARVRVRERFAAQERFLLNVSHEIKTPISVMLTEAQTIDRRVMGEDARAFVDSVEEEMLKLGRLVESFLTLTRIQDGKILTTFRPYGLNDLVMDCVDSSRRMAEQHNVRISPSLLADDATMETAVSGERELLRTMADNLVRNAIRFSPEGGIVHVSAGVSGDVATFVVRDDGPGIPPDRIDDIFDRFSQAPNQPRQGRGHGLGLTIAMGIAELHGGTIAAANLPGRGCEFTVTLPVCPAPCSDPGPAPTPVAHAPAARRAQ